MKILQVMAGAKHGGAETAFVDMCIALHEAGETVEVVTRTNDLRVPVLEAAGLKVHTLSFGGHADVFTRWKIASIIKKFQPDIVQTWMARASWKTPRWSEAMKIPRYMLVSRLGGYYKLKYFKSADHFMTNTPDLRRYVIENGIASERVTHINNFAPEEKAEAPLPRADFGTPMDAPLVLALGRLHPSKAFDVLIKAVAGLPGVYLWIAGEGPKRKELEDLITELKAGERVKLIGWQSDRAALFAAGDICVVSSRFEPFGAVFVQAWAQKVPLITTDSAGPKQYVRDGEDALLVPMEEVEALRAAIARLIGDKTMKNQLVEAGYQRYLAEFTKENTVRRYLELYHALRKGSLNL
jgi:glycosyltransferase involved in cell wall biosynthesis